MSASKVERVRFKFILLFFYSSCQCGSEGGSCAEIVAANQGVQANYERQHTVEKVFPGMFNGKDELMLYGFAKVRAREDGAESVVDFAGHIQLVKQNGELKISKYCMHLVSVVVLF